MNERPGPGNSAHDRTLSARVRENGRGRKRVSRREVTDRDALRAHVRQAYIDRAVLDVLKQSRAEWQQDPASPDAQVLRWMGPLASIACASCWITGPASVRTLRDLEGD